MDGTEAVLRVVRGQANEVELAALTAVLLALRAGEQEEGEEPPAAAGSPWWKLPGSYAAPGSWR
jgi:hypothetical protein